jgi:hypothetical protein
MKTFSLLLPGLFFASFALSANAQIYFGKPVGITQDPSQISTLGTYVDAVGVNDYSSTSIQVGTTTFNPLFSDTGITFSSPTGIGGGSDGSGSNATPFQQVLNGVAYVGDFNPADVQTGTVSLNFLLPSHVYQVQVFSLGNFQTQISGATTKNLFRDYSIGIFTADATTQTFTFNSSLSGIGEINAIALRDVTAEVPEPSAWALMLGGVTLLVALSLRRSKPSLH